MPFAFAWDLSTDDDFVESQPGMSADMPASMSVDIDMPCCIIGHSPARPLAASPLMGSTAQSSSRMIVRRNFMAGIIARGFAVWRGVDEA
ncbi:hypothetical protein BCCH1_25900 [Burkholderia contaminans]|uniref:Uncharacterized protein n=1 Tax=Burkholderia contaminans TaxID=488447 RepID=A0A250L6D5_9BURK|nr:hypothetical protein BCCH1_25900 [Burkholderia contaminans]GLZ69070.1 hypothetical protein Bcon01_21150 [Burkholderia contaminans]